MNMLKLTKIKLSESMTKLNESRIGRALLGAVVLSFPLTLGGCVAGANAIPLATARSGCGQSAGGGAAAMLGVAGGGGGVKVIKQDGHDVVLEVCGTYEKWKWHAWNGWEYVGPADEQPEPEDGDGDGVPSAEDACPKVAGAASEDPKTNGCPPAADNDNDGIADADDKCADEPGVKSDDPARNGCPADADDDGIDDKNDACPKVAGEAALKGCPDKDSDGIADKDDQCPDVAGTATSEKKGCPPEPTPEPAPEEGAPDTPE